MKNLTQHLLAAVLLVGASAFAQATSATQTVTTNISGAVSITLNDGGSDSTTLSDTLSNVSGGQSTNKAITIKVNSSETSGFNVTASADNNGFSQGHLCEYDTGTSSYLNNCLFNAVQIATASSIPKGTTGAGPIAATSLSASALKIFSSDQTVSNGTITSTVSQLIDWTDKVASNDYRIVITYTIASGV